MKKDLALPAELPDSFVFTDPAGLTDEQGWMPKEITADNDSHLNADGFDIFVRNLLDYAQARYEQGQWVPDPALMKEGETPQ